MNKLTEIKQTIERLADVIYSAGMDEESEELRETVNDIFSLLEEKEKALAFYADKKKYNDGNECHDPHAPINADVTDSTIILDGGDIARKALNTSSNNEGD